VTGASSGIGAYTAKALASTGCTVVLASRNLAACEAVAANIRLSQPKASLICLRLDLSSLLEVRRFHEEFVQRSESESWPPLSRLVLNAGVTGNKFTKNKAGFEMCFATNHLGHFLLTVLLLPKLHASYHASSVPSRVVVVSSDAHHGPLTTKAWSDKAELLSKVAAPEHGVDGLSEGMKWYANSKLCNVLFAQELHRRESSNGVVSCSLHPGTMMATSLGRESWLASFALKYLLAPISKSMSQGCATTVKCTVVEPGQLQGQYWADCEPTRASRLATEKGEEAGAVLWELSAGLCAAGQARARL